MTRFDDQQPWINTYYVEGAVVYQEEREHVPLEIGQGFIDARQDYHRFRVVDIWLSTDSHGRFDIGRHVFLEDVTGSDDDLPAILAPSYYSE